MQGLARAQGAEFGDTQNVLQILHVVVLSNSVAYAWGQLLAHIASAT